MLPQAATAVPRDRDSIEPGAETGPAGAPADSSQWLREIQAVKALWHAVDYLVFAGRQWERGESAAATSDAIGLLRTRITEITGWPTPNRRDWFKTRPSVIMR